jgi:hypothetical protein
MKMLKRKRVIHAVAWLFAVSFLVPNISCTQPVRKQIPLVTADPASVLHGWDIFQKYDGDPLIRPEEEYLLINDLAQMADRMKDQEILEYYYVAREGTLTPKFYYLEDSQGIIAWFRSLSSYGLKRERGLGLIRLYEDFIRGVDHP